MGHQDWPRRVALEYHERLPDEPLHDNPIRRLILAKRAIRRVTQNMQREHLVQQASGSDDKLGWTMAYIRAVESIKMAQCAVAYPYLATQLEPSDPNARTNPKIAHIREHALELARG